MRLLNSDDIQAAMPMNAAVAAMRDAFVTISSDGATVAERQSLPLEQGTGLLMGAAAPGVGFAAKLVSVVPGNASRGLPGTIGSLMLVDEADGRPLALMDGTALTAWRTAALSACAVDLLARPGARRALLLGCGTQAATQVLGLDAVRQLDEIAVHAPDRDKVQAFIEAQQGRVKARLAPVGQLAQAVAQADIVVAATNSDRPVFDAREVSPGCHVNGVGSFRHGMHEIDPALAARADVFVESRRTAASEGGELMAAVEQGISRTTDWVELGEVLAGKRDGRAGPDRITFFKSVGHAVFDLYAARATYDAALERGLGGEWAG